MKPIEPLEASLELVEVIIPPLIELTLLSSPLMLQKSLVMINSSLVQGSKIITVTPLLFDLIIEGILLYYVLIFITLIIDSNRKNNDTFNRTININDMFRLD
jgi:hypothetical protein